MASSMRSWWSAAWISRPTTRSAADHHDLPHPRGDLLDGRLPGHGDLGVGGLNDAVMDGLGVALCSELGLVGRGLGLGDDLPCPAPGLLQQGAPLGVGLLGVGLGLVGGLELAAYLLLALGQHLVEVWDHGAAR